MKRQLTFSLIPLVVLFAAVELGLRATDWPQVTANFEHNEPFWVVDPDLKNHPMPHKEESTTFSVSSNPDGLRTAITSYDSSKQRVMTMGCSTTFGWGVDQSESYPEQLQQRLNQAGYTSVEVLNAGQPGYTSFQGNWLWDQVLKQYSPDVVFLGFIVQDARKAAYSDKSQAILQSDNRFLKDNFLYRSKVYLGLRHWLGSVQIRAKERSNQDEGGVFRVPPEDYVNNLRSLVSKIESSGSQPVLFGYPLERTGYTENHRAILKAASEQLSIPVFDPQSRMEDATKSSAEPLYFPRDKGHANANGNALIAEWVFDFLTENQLVKK